MKERLMQYPATIAGLIGLIGLVVAAALFLSNEAEGSQRFSQLIGLASVGVMILANNLRMDAATEKAKEAASTAGEVKQELVTAIEQSGQTTPAALAALTELLKRSEDRVIEEVKTVVANGNGGD